MPQLRGKGPGKDLLFLKVCVLGAVAQAARDRDNVFVSLAVKPPSEVTHKKWYNAQTLHPPAIDRSIRSRLEASSQGTIRRKLEASSHPQTQTGTGLVWTSPVSISISTSTLKPEPTQTAHPPGLDRCPGKVDGCKEQIRRQERDQSSIES